MGTIENQYNKTHTHTITQKRRWVCQKKKKKKKKKVMVVVGWLPEYRGRNPKVG